MNVIGSVDDQERGIGKTEPGRSLSQVKQSAFACSEITFNWVLLKQDHVLALSCHTSQGQTLNLGLATIEPRRAPFDGRFKFAKHVEVEEVGDEGVIGGPVLHFQSSALIRRSAYNTKISMNQFEERESTTDFNQSQSLCILANFG